MQESSREQILSEITSAIVRIASLSAEPIREDQRLLEDLKLDSLAIYELVVDLEDLYGMQISNEDAERLDTVGDTVDYVARRLRYN